MREEEERSVVQLLKLVLSFLSFYLSLLLKKPKDRQCCRDIKRPRARPLPVSANGSKHLRRRISSRHDASPFSFSNVLCSSFHGARRKSSSEPKNEHMKKDHRCTSKQAWANYMNRLLRPRLHPFLLLVSSPPQLLFLINILTLAKTTPSSKS